MPDPNVISQGPKFELRNRRNERYKIDQVARVEPVWLAKCRLPAVEQTARKAPWCIVLNWQPTSLAQCFEQGPLSCAVETYWVIVHRSVAEIGPVRLDVSGDFVQRSRCRFGVNAVSFCRLINGTNKIDRSWLGRHAEPFEQSVPTVLPGRVHAHVRKADSRP